MVTKAEEAISSFELDALKETANIGTGHATIALSALMNRKVNITIPNTTLVSVHEVGGKITSANEAVVGIYSKMRQGIAGNIVIILPTSCAYRLIDFINKKAEGEQKKDILNKEDIATLKKLGSLLYSAYLTALANFFEQNIVFQKPNIVSTFGDSIVDFILVQIGEQEKVLLISINFDVEGTDIKGDFVLLFTLTSLSPLLENLKKKMGMA
ncbi:chemotaxis protein CheC [Candidatus Woesearchaeota archaeon]|nr:chemotaxis protein CheC [Candidatus Woesearchaeota archaeon]